MKAKSIFNFFDRTISFKEKEVLNKVGEKGQKIGGGGKEDGRMKEGGRDKGLDINEKNEYFSFVKMNLISAVNQILIEEGDLEN